MTALAAGVMLGLGFELIGEPSGSFEIRPLNPISKTSGDTLFARLGLEEVGIAVNNEYADPKMWNERYNEFALGAIGTGIAIADYDNDGRPDIYFVNKTGRSELYRNLGDWKFEQVTEQAGLVEESGGFLDSVSGWFSSDDDSPQSVEIWKQGAAFADVDNDGWQDLYVCRHGAPNQLFINKGNGTFEEAENARGLNLSSASGMAHFCDFNRDGWLDVYVQTNMLDSRANPEGSRDRLYLNNGDGHFTDVTKRAGIQGETLGHSATWWDYDEDGWPDLFVANDFAKPDQLFRNECGSGEIRFTEVVEKVVRRQSHSSMGADLGDVNNDGHIDLLVAEMAPTDHEMDMRGMGVTRYTMRDVEGSETTAPQFMFNVLHLNSGVGLTMETAWMAGLARTDWTWSVRFEDLDCDGLLDLHVTNGMVREFQNDDLRQRIFRAEHPSARMRIMHSSPALAESNLAYRNLGDLRFERRETQWGLDEVGVSFGASFGDFDGDGDLDLVYSNFDAPPSLFRNDASKGSRLVVELRGDRSNRFGIGAVVRLNSASGEQIRELVLARGYLSSSEPAIHFGLGEDERVDRLEITWPSGHVQTLQDLPVNHRVVVHEPSGSQPRPEVQPDSNPLLAVWEEGPTFEPVPGRTPPRPDQPLTPVSDRRRGPALAVGDLDGDGVADAVIGSSGGDSTQALLSSRSFDPAELPVRSFGFADGALALADFDADGDLDTVVASSSGKGAAARVLLNDGAGGFSDSGWVIPESDAAIASTSVGDFDGDGFPDLFLGARSPRGSYPLPGTSLLLRGTGSGFENASSLLPENGKLGVVSDSLWSDVDGDGAPDLIVTTEWGAVRCLVSGSDGFEDASDRLGFDAAGDGWWQSLASGDFNGDGLPDFALGNVGLNTPYRASPEEPALLYFGDFGGRGPGQIVEGRWDSGRLVPLRSRKELGDAMPALLRRFRSNDDFAAATLEEVFGTETLSSARRFSLSELRSGVLLSGPSGYTYKAFPRFAQASPLRSIAVVDVDRDGILDLACAQNLHEVDPVVGRFDGGLGQLLLGDGSGGFRALSPAESGLLIPGDAASIEAGDFDGDGLSELLATRWAAPLLGFRITVSAKEGGEFE